MRLPEKGPPERQYRTPAGGKGGKGGIGKGRLSLALITSLEESVSKREFIRIEAEGPAGKQDGEGLCKTLFLGMRKGCKKPPFRGIFQFAENLGRGMPKYSFAAALPQIHKTVAFKARLPARVRLKACSLEVKPKTARPQYRRHLPEKFPVSE
jgi:hypothetical protein